VSVPAPTGVGLTSRSLVNRDIHLFEFGSARGEYVIVLAGDSGDTITADESLDVEFLPDAAGLP